MEKLMRISNNNIDIQYIDCSPFRADEIVRIEQRILRQFKEYYHLKKVIVPQISARAIYTRQQPIIYSQLSDASANFLIENVLNRSVFAVPNDMDQVVALRKKHTKLLSERIPNPNPSVGLFKLPGKQDDNKAIVGSNPHLTL